jgi:hypothetical protein
MQEIFSPFDNILNGLAVVKVLNFQWDSFVFDVFTVVVYAEH